jgi:hypothetical protein
VLIGGIVVAVSVLGFFIYRRYKKWKWLGLMPMDFK